MLRVLLLAVVLHACFCVESWSPQALTLPFPPCSFLPLRRRAGGRAIKQVVTKFVPSSLHAAADAEMESVLNAAYAGVRDLLARNRAALDALVEALLARDTLTGEEVRGLVVAHGAEADLRRREAEAAVFM